jgi:HD-like signal output (HDOD) protein
VQALLSDLDTDSNELAAVIRLDSSLAPRVLKASNSAFFARSDPIASIEEAREIKQDAYKKWQDARNTTS